MLSCPARVTATGRDRNRTSGTIGCALRACTASKLPKAPAATTNAAMTGAAPKPVLPASMQA
jgi:hypothetical protein